ncbi:UDP-N-acetylmuramoyl-L-alanyl-D-glutamate--2,6-diaminopimelate ligase [Patescibacteria group bacterium]|nr:UDP-N-acetylmuramoyl-L-alanyl-D-glutamate--2,6-diaminopimelate ligase [Patescibacteria group bacterium]
MKKLLRKLIPDWLLSIYHWKLALLGALVYGFPSRKLKMVGVTGTKGKSTVVVLAGRVLAEKFSTSSNNKPAAGWISSLTINDGKSEIMNPYHMTMPGRFFIQKTLRQMVKNGCQYALVEVTSEGIKQFRHQFINWAGAVFTNLALEHLEAHGGFANYRAVKMKLFEAASKNPESFGVYNLDDENAEWFLKYPIKNKFGYYLDPSTRPAVAGLAQGIKKVLPERSEAKSKAIEKLQVLSLSLNSNGSEFEINGVKFKTNLLGEFNVQNCAAAVAIGQACGVSLEVAAQALGKIQSIPGRLEIINEGQDFTVVVDLAHTPDSFGKVFKLFKDLLVRRSPAQRDEGGAHTHNKIISVFGSAGGGRDKWKRPELGQIASQYSDQIFITNEDPYDEDPLYIADEILAGCDKTRADIILDRRQAIAKALNLAQAGDIVLVLGKGTEQTYVEGNKKIYWDDRVVVREEIKKRLVL